MPKIFISYRRADSKIITGRIYDHLARAFGKNNIFKDVDNIPPGQDFRGVLREATARCDIMLVIIGSDWLTIRDSNGNFRLQDPEDFVRLEVETGLQRKNVTVIPVLVKNAKPPSAKDLPDTLKQLAYNNAFTIQDDPNFTGDMQRLISKIDPLRFWRRMATGFVALAIVVALIAGFLFFSNQSPDDQSAGEQTIEAEAVEATPEITEVPSDTATIAPTHTDTAVPTHTPTDTPSPTETETHTPVPSNTPITPTATLTAVPSDTPTTPPVASNTPIPQPTNTTITVASYPCDGTIEFGTGGMLSRVYILPNPNSPRRSPVQRGADVTITEQTRDVGTTWYKIEYNDDSGWIESRDIELEANCPQ